MQSPTNAIAIEVQRLRTNNEDIDARIQQLQERKVQNAEAIAELESHATWEEIVVEETADDSAPETTG